MPQIFFGREAELAQIVQMITTNIGSRPARIAILGPGGYGKTTLAHAVLTVDTIREHFGDAIYFVPCESVMSSGALLAELGKSLGVVNSGPDALWSRIHAKLTSKDSITCFDNFESPWDQHVETKHAVEELLSRVTELRHVTVLITMRGVERPARTQWNQPFLKPLETLGHDAAKGIWQAIAGNYDNYSEKLIEAVDYVPLAVDLLSHLSQVTPPALLWKEWNSKHTMAIQTGQEHRLSNLEYSIQLSVNSERMKVNPSAQNLLGVLCILPDGLHMEQLSKFGSMLVGLDIGLCLQTLMQCSLIKLNEERYQPHPIIRYFCLNQGMLLSQHKAVIESFYITLALSEYEKASPDVYREMMLEVNNTKATLLSLLDSNYEDVSKLINACNTFTRFCCNIGDHSDKVISQAVEFVKPNSSAVQLLVQSLFRWSELYFLAYNFEKAKEKLQEAEKYCLFGQNVINDSYGSILQAFGYVYQKQNALNDAESCYQTALGLFKKSNNTLQEGWIYTKLRDLCGFQGKLDEAITLYQSAIQCYKNVDHPFYQGISYKGLGWTYLKQKKLPEAEAALQIALNFHKRENSLLDQGNVFRLLGEVYMALHKVEVATGAFQNALEFHKAANDALGQGNDYEALGRIKISQDELNEAEILFKKALELHTVAHDALGQGNDCFDLGKLYMKREQLYDAEKMFEKAMVLHKQAQDGASEEEDVEYLNIVITKMKECGIL